MRTVPSHGFGVVELMVALAAGLFVLAGAVALLAATTADARRSHADARAVQDLRSAADTVSRVLRRAGHWGAAAQAVGADAVVPNPYRAFAQAGGAVTLAFSRDAAEDGVLDANERFGLRLQSGAVQLLLGSAGWQSLTDPAALVVTALRLEPASAETALAPGACGPRHVARHVDVVLEGRAPLPGSPLRRLASRVVLRNDLVVDPCAP